MFSTARFVYYFLLLFMSLLVQLAFKLYNSWDALHSQTLTNFCNRRVLWSHYLHDTVMLWYVFGTNKRHVGTYLAHCCLVAVKKPERRHESEIICTHLCPLGTCSPHMREPRLQKVIVYSTQNGVDKSLCMFIKCVEIRTQGSAVKRASDEQFFRHGIILLVMSTSC